jgi:VWFA-related protein
MVEIFMMSNILKIRLAAALLLVAAIAAQSAAQSGRLRDQSPSRNQNDEPLRLRIEEVLLPVSVRNNFGFPPSDLKQSDFIVTEDGRRQEVNAVMRTPANLLFVLDTSGESVIKNVNINRDLALKMIQSLGAEDRAAIITYGDTIQLLSGWTSDKTALRRALDWKFKPSLKADFYTSLIYAADEALSKVSGRRSVVVITDGVDSFEKPVIEGATLSFEKALIALHRARATVYIASQNEIIMSDIKPQAFNALSWYERLDPKARKRIDQLRKYYRQLEASEVQLKGIAEETGGMIWIPATRAEFEKLSLPIVAEIGTECVLAYSTERPPDDQSFHAIKVYGARPDLLIRFRRGIYANLVKSRTPGAMSYLFDGAFEQPGDQSADIF